MAQTLAQPTTKWHLLTLHPRFIKTGRKKLEWTHAQIHLELFLFGHHLKRWRIQTYDNYQERCHSWLEKDMRKRALASCLIYAWPLRPDRWLVGARLVDSWFFFDFLKTMYHLTIYHSNLSDQSALEIGLGLGLDSGLHYFSIFPENKENEHPFFRKCHGR